jgi:nucleoside-diphosphate-sugar epimerase
MRVLIVGGTGLISVGIVKHLLARKAEVVMFNRGQRKRNVPTSVGLITGDRNDPGFARAFQNERFDVVIDMICFTPEQAKASVAAFGGRCEQLIFCSTVCTYGVSASPTKRIDENHPQKPISSYGRNKVACERIFRKAHDAKRFNATIVRPSHTYGEGHPLIDQLDFDARSWDRIKRGQPVLVADEGKSLWQSTHRDDCGKLFAHACLRPKTYGEDYNATRDEVMSWREYYQEVALALGKAATILSLPADRIITDEPARFGLLKEITRFPGAYSSAKAKRHIPEFRCEIGLKEGAARVFKSQRARKAWPDSRTDEVYNRLAAAAVAANVHARMAR